MSDKTTEKISAEDEMEQHLQELRAARQESGDPGIIDVTAKVVPDTQAAAAAPEPAPSPAASGGAAPAPATTDASNTAATTPAASASAPAATTPNPVEEVQKKVQEAQAELHRLTSEIGRIGPLNTALQDERRRSAELQKQLDASRAAPASKEEAHTRLAAMAEQVKGFPELVSVVNAVADALKENNERAESAAKTVAAKVVEPFDAMRRQHEETQTQNAQAAYTAALELFNGTYPTASQVVKTAEFRQWIVTQPAQIRNAYQNGTTPQEAIPVMDAYDAHLRRNGKPSIASNPTNQQQPAADPAAANTPAPAPAPSQKSTQNDDRLRRAAGFPSRQTGSAGSMPPADDFDASLAYFRGQRLKRAATAAA